MADKMSEQARCATHHHACACREAMFAEVVEALDGLADVASESVELSDWPELDEALDKAGNVLARWKGEQP